MVSSPFKGKPCKAEMAMYKIINVSILSYLDYYLVNASKFWVDYNLKQSN